MTSSTRHSCGARAGGSAGISIRLRYRSPPHDMEAMLGFFSRLGIVWQSQAAIVAIAHAMSDRRLLAPHGSVDVNAALARYISSRRLDPSTRRSAYTAQEAEKASLA